MNREFVTVNVLGKDRSGAVARITSLLFSRGANIEQLVEKVTRRDFHMNLVASFIRGTLDPHVLGKDFATLSRELRMDITVRHVREHVRQRMAIFITKEYHCIEAIMKAVRSGSLKAEPVLVVSNHREAATAARRYRLPFFYANFQKQEQAETRVLKALADAEVDFVVLARFMKILSPRFAWHFQNRILNIHPSLLPAFPGASAYRQAYDHGVKIVGVTSHFVTPDLDGGPIICQDAIALRSQETLPSIIERGRKLEAAVLLKAIRLYLSNRLDVHWGKVMQV